MATGLALIVASAWLASANAPPAVADLDLVTSVRAVAEHVTRLRERPFAEAPLAVRATPELLRSAAEARAASWLPTARRGPRGRAWADLGLGDEAAVNEVLRRLASGVPGMAVADGRLLVAPGVLPSQEATLADLAEWDDEALLISMTGVAADEPIAAHYLVHLMRSRRAGGDNTEDPTTTDALLASRARLEGEANLVALLYLFEGMDLTSAVVERGIEPADVLDGRLVPRVDDTTAAVVGRFVEFVYVEGFAHQRDRFAKGGWEDLDRAASARTTASVLHPDRPETRPATAAPSTPPPPVGGVSLRDEDSIGEQGIVVLISKLTGKDNLALLAGDGWRSDRLLRWESDGGDGATEWLTRWASSEDAADFDYAYRRGIGVLCGAEPAVAEGRWRASCRGRVWTGASSADEARIRVHPATWDPWLQGQEKEKAKE